MRTLRSSKLGNLSKLKDAGKNWESWEGGVELRENGGEVKVVIKESKTLLIEAWE